MLYQICNGAVQFGGDVILKSINFEIRNTEKIAVVGRNGCGKTTFLKLIAGDVDLAKRDSDEDIFIAKSGNPEIGYLKQMAFSDLSLTMEQEIRKAFHKIETMKAQLEELTVLMEHNHEEETIRRFTRLQENFENLGGYFYEKEYEMLIVKFGFSQEDKKKPLSQFSGGQQTKIAFIKLLLSKPDILLLDEPTNHLDISTVEWLEKYLKDYKKAVVVVSHDRMFLDNIADVVYEIEYGATKRYPGNYTHFVETKKLNYEQQKKNYAAQQKEIERLQQIVDKFKNKPTKAAMTRSKLKQIEHMDLIEAPDRYDNKTFHANFQPTVETGKDVLSVRDLEIGYADVLSKVSIEVKKGEKVGIIGGNGLGKSTFLKTLMRKIPKISGTFQFGANVQIGYFDQQMAQYTSEKTVLDDFWDEFPNLTQTEVRNLLGAFLFSGEDVFKKVSMLSGGEKVRLALCKILKREPNVLILDEPTNHMDIVGKETLESMLREYAGTLILVSHDRYFIKKVCDKLLVFENHNTILYPFGYEQYKEECEKLLAEAGDLANVKSSEKTDKNRASGDNDNKTRKKAYYNPGKEQAKLERKIKKLEEQMQQKEEACDRKKQDLLNEEYQSDYVKLGQIQEEIDALEEEILEIMTEWEELMASVSEE
ncbi:MAG: ABC-F family ATP-binding cassette domain-containing protein [Lachnospiraceae bacterium]|nr:ABC-F family ATP-binding cassette domain-containing protein [Lachnospiraceae bacterium]